MIDVNRKGEVWVFIEQHDGQIEEPSLELMSKARQLADMLGVKLGAMLPGDKDKGWRKELFITGRTRYMWRSICCLRNTRRTATRG